MVMTMRRRERRLKLILMIYTALIFVGMSSYYNLSVVVESFAFVSITPNNMISSSPSSPEQRRRRRKISCNDDFHRRRRKRKFTEIYTQLSSSKKSEAEEETDIASTTINSDSDSIRKLLSDLNKNKNNNDDGFGEYFDFDGEIQEMDDAMMEEIKEGQPSEFNIMKEVSFFLFFYQHVANKSID
ncbi:MAG: hypothetical protein ACI8RD_013229 [Bacillariaceae sp.]|jgi:hypothetical protein